MQPRATQMQRAPSSDAVTTSIPSAVIEAELATMSRATLLKLALSAREKELDPEKGRSRLPPKNLDYDIHRNGEPWEMAVRRVSGRGFTHPSEEERNCDGPDLLGRTVFVQNKGEGHVVGFRANRTGPSWHIIEFAPARGGEQDIKLRRKGNTETEWLVLSPVAEERARRTRRGKEQTYKKLIEDSKRKTAGVEIRMTPEEREERERRLEEQAMVDASYAERRAQLVEHWKMHKPQGTTQKALSKRPGGSPEQASRSGSSLRTSSAARAAGASLSLRAAEDPIGGVARATDESQWDSEIAPPEDEPPAPPPVSNLHVRGIGVDGWDGTDDGVGTYESEAALKKIFEVFGPFVQATVRHRIADGKNTSYAIVTMLTNEAVEAALNSEEPVMAGRHPLTLTRFSAKTASESTGAMGGIRVAARAKIKDALAVMPAESFEQPPAAAAPTEEPVPPPQGARFEGWREGFVFTTRDGRTDYWPDSMARLPQPAAVVQPPDVAQYGMPPPPPQQQQQQHQQHQMAVEPGLAQTGMAAYSPAPAPPVEEHAWAAAPPPSYTQPAVGGNGHGGSAPLSQAGATAYAHAPAPAPPPPVEYSRGGASQLQPPPAFGGSVYYDDAQDPSAAVAAGLLHTGALLQDLGRTRLRQLSHNQRGSMQAADVAEQLDRLASLQDLWQRTSAPARTGLPRLAAQKQAEYEAILELTEALGTHLLQADQRLMAGRTAADGGATAGFLMAARQILDQPPHEGNAGGRMDQLEPPMGSGGGGAMSAMSGIGGDSAMDAAAGTTASWAPPGGPPVQGGYGAGAGGGSWYSR